MHGRWLRFSQCAGDALKDEGRGEQQVENDAFHDPW